jgi:5-methyltetrahydrofolate--homocysteine methyltransferase
LFSRFTWFLEEENIMSKTLEQLGQKVYDGEEEAVAELTQKALDSGMDPQEILSGGLIAGMDVVGRDFKAGDLFVPEVLIAARAMSAGMRVLRPLLAESDAPRAGRFLIGTVRGDLHDIGKNLVKMMIEGAGFETIDLGTDVEPQVFVDAVRQHQPDIVGMSALLTTTMTYMRTTIEALEEAGLRDQVKVMIGGAPVTAAFAEQVGADGYSPDAASAVDMAREIKG